MVCHVFEALVKKVQGSDAYPASAKFYPDGEGKVHGIYHLAQGVKTILPKETCDSSALC